jgi:hypothetical protein
LISSSVAVIPSLTRCLRRSSTRASAAAFRSS